MKYLASGFFAIVFVLGTAVAGSALLAGAIEQNNPLLGLAAAIAYLFSLGVIYVIGEAIERDVP